MFYEAQYYDAVANNPSLTTPEEIHKNINWWIFNSFGGPTLDETDIDPATGQPTIYKGEKIVQCPLETEMSSHFKMALK